MKTRNSELLESFQDYCIANPDQRFWQALRNWAEVDFVYVVPNGGPITKAVSLPIGYADGEEEVVEVFDTFYLEGKKVTVPGE